MLKRDLHEWKRAQKSPQASRQREAELSTKLTWSKARVEGLLDETPACFGLGSGQRTPSCLPLLFGFGESLLGTSPPAAPPSLGRQTLGGVPSSHARVSPQKSWGQQGGFFQRFHLRKVHFSPQRRMKACWKGQSFSHDGNFVSLQSISSAEKVKRG